MMMTKPAPSAPVISHLRPLITHWLPSSRAVACSMPGSEPAPPGSVMAKQERILPSAKRLQEMRALVGPRHDVEQMDVALVGRGAVDRRRPQDGIARRLEDEGAADLAEGEAAILPGHMRGEHAG